MTKPRYCEVQKTGSRAGLLKPITLQFKSLCGVCVSGSPVRGLRLDRNQEINVLRLTDWHTCSAVGSWSWVSEYFSVPRDIPELRTSWESNYCYFIKTYTHTSVDVVIIKVANLCSKGMCEWVLHYLLNLAWTMLSKFFWLFVHGTILSFLSLGPQKYRNSHKNHWKIEGVTKPQ